MTQRHSKTQQLTKERKDSHHKTQRDSYLFNRLGETGDKLNRSSKTRKQMKTQTKTQLSASQQTQTPTRQISGFDSVR